MTQPLVLHAAEETLEAVHTRRHTAYPAYKPSGVEWLGDVPEHWDVKRLKFVARTIMGQSPSSEEYALDENDTPFLQGNAEFGKFNPIARYYCETATKHAPAESILISVRAPVGAVNIADRAYGIGRGLCAVVPDLTMLSLTFAWHTFSVTRNELWSIATGSTYEAVTAGEVAAMSLPVPPLEEQQAIARFLDEQTRKIDDLIEAKRSLLDLLKEKRQAVITHAVTRGLDPAAKLKPSGVEWLGDVPEHWTLTPLKHLTRFLNGMAFKPEQWSDDGYPIIRIENLNGGDSFNCFDGEVPRHYHVREGDLLFGWSGNRGTSFGPFLWWREGLHYLNQHIFKLYGYECNKSWFYWTLKSLTTYMEEEAHGIIGMVHITKGKLGAVKVPVPPLEEQQEIARFLEEETEKMDDLESVVREAIETLESLRAGIISAAVTGKIDVREEGV